MKVGASVLHGRVPDKGMTWTTATGPEKSEDVFLSLLLLSIIYYIHIVLIG